MAKHFPSKWDRRVLRTFKKENPVLEGIPSKNTFIRQTETRMESVLSEEWLTQEKIDYIIQNESLIDCEIYIIKLLDKRAWKSEMSLYPDVSKLAKNIMDRCSDEELNLLKEKIYANYPEEEHLDFDYPLEAEESG